MYDVLSRVGRFLFLLGVGDYMQLMRIWRLRCEDNRGQFPVVYGGMKGLHVSWILGCLSHSVMVVGGGFC